MLTLTDQDFQRLYVYIKQNYGIDLSKKKQLIVSRLSHTLAAQGFRDFKGYVDEILSGRDTDMVTAMLNKLTTNYTYFLREEAHFKYFQEIVLPDLERKHARDKSLAIWSAGCSSGQEPYTIAMALNEYFGTRRSLWKIQLLATDISVNVLTKACNGIYENESLNDVPQLWKTKYFKRLPNGNFQVSDSIRKSVDFRTLNLMDPFRFRKPFDIIFCRNVMIYFDQPTKDALVRRFYDATVPGGYLMISHSENLGKNNPYATVAPSTFQKKS